MLAVAIPLGLALLLYIAIEPADVDDLTAQHPVVRVLSEDGSPVEVSVWAKNDGIVGIQVWSVPPGQDARIYVEGVRDFRLIGEGSESVVITETTNSYSDWPAFLLEDVVAVEVDLGKAVWVDSGGVAVLRTPALRGDVWSSGGETRATASSVNAQAVGFRNAWTSRPADASSTQSLRWICSPDGSSDCDGGLDEATSVFEDPGRARTVGRLNLLVGVLLGVGGSAAVTAIAAWPPRHRSEAFPLI